MHTSVLVDEVLHFLKPESNGNFIDCTAGSGGHSKSILGKTEPKGKVLAFEWDKDLYKLLKKKEDKRFSVVNESYTNLKEVVDREAFYPVNGILFDLGFSSFHVDESKRGFSFMRDEVLDMRYNREILLTAKEIVNKAKEKDLFYILKNYGEEEYAGRIAKKIVFRRENKPIKNTGDLVKIVESAVPEEYKERRIHCATKTFQAIRIAVNAELLNLKAALPQALEILEKGGRIVVICFHGGEEEIVKSFFKKSNVEIITKSPTNPAEEEINKNVRSRSAKLYAVTKK